MRILSSGYVSLQSGSVASANALLLKALLERGHEVHFFSKASFVDPRPVLGERPGFTFTDTENIGCDRLRRTLEGVPLLGGLASLLDSSSYDRLVLERIRKEARVNGADTVLWLGQFSLGDVPGCPAVSFAQGAPGTDARSIINRWEEIRRLSLTAKAWKWKILARLRLSSLGTPRLHHSGRIIVGSSQSREALQQFYGVEPGRVSTLPYPINVDLFRPPTEAAEPWPELRVLWLGRIVPRKRLDLFLDGAARAIRDGSDLRLTIVGRVGFVPGYEKLIEQFAYQDRLCWKKSVPRDEVPALMNAHDLLCQPSDEENFGSSVAEAQACGLPVIVGRTNGNADYLCRRDIHLADDRPETLAEAFRVMAERKQNGAEAWGSPRESRALAEETFSVERVTDRLEEILEDVRAKGASRK